MVDSEKEAIHDDELKKSSDGMKQIKNSLLYFLPVIVSTVIPIMTLPVFTRILSKEDYGLLALAQIYGTLINGLANFGMQLAYERNYFEYRDSNKKTAQLLYSVLLFVTLNFVVLASFTFVFGSIISKMITGSNEHGVFLFWVTISYFLSGISYYYLTYFKNSEEARPFVTYTVAAGLINLVIAVVLVAYYKIGVIGLVYGQISAGVIIFLILSCKFVASHPPTLSRSILSDTLKIGYPLTPRIIFGVISKQSDKYLIGLLGSIGGVGIYSIGQKISLTVFSYMTALENVFSPRVYSKMFDAKENASDSIGMYLTPFVYISTSLALLVALLSEEIVSVLTPSSYHGAIDIVIVLAMFYGVQFFGKLSGLQLLYARKTHVTSMLTLVTIGFHLAVSIPFILMWGAIGAAWAMLFGGIGSLVVWFVLGQHYYRINWEYVRVAVVFLVFLLSAILMIILRDLMIAYYLRVLVKLSLIVIYLYVGAKIQVVTRNNLLLLRKAVLAYFPK